MSALLFKKRTKKTVLFLCTGDTCRGPMAQGYMKHAMVERGIKNVEVRTAGVMTIPGLIPTPEAQQVMRNANIEVNNHRSSPLTPEVIRKADLILGMTPFHVQFALRLSDDAKGKTYLLKEYAESDMKNYQITDPMGATLEVYKRVYREMKLAIDKMLDTKEIFTGMPEDEARKVAATKKKAEGGKPATDKKPAAPAKAAAAPAKAPAKAPAAAPAKKDAPPAKPAPAKPATTAAKPAPAEAKPAAAAKAPAKPVPPAKKEAPTKKDSPAASQANAKKKAATK